MALYRWIRTESRWNKKLIYLSSTVVTPRLRMYIPAAQPTASRHWRHSVGGKHIRQWILTGDARRLLTAVGFVAGIDTMRMSVTHVHSRQTTTVTSQPVQWTVYSRTAQQQASDSAPCLLSLHPQATSTNTMLSNYRVEYIHWFSTWRSW